MSLLQVHYMAMEAERRLLPAQAERGRLLDEVVATERRMSPHRTARARWFVGATLVRANQVLRGRQQAAPALSPRPTR